MHIQQAGQQIPDRFQMGFAWCFLFSDLSAIRSLPKAGSCADILLNGIWKPKTGALQIRLAAADSVCFSGI